MSRKNKERRKTLSCGAVVWRVNEGRLELLLIKQFAHKDSWGIPKGRIDHGETLEECARREVREETGVNISLGERLPDCGTYLKNEDKTVVSFLASPVDSHDIKHDDPDNEVADARWIPVDVLPQINVYQQQLIAIAIDRLQLSLKTLNSNVLAALAFVYSYAGHVDYWITIKKELLKALPPDDRRLFSTRDPVTKRQLINDFERCVAEHWSKMT
jgi:8-oxo-dGTP pyrophosphatase MutT (NUDIX family)